VSSLQFRSKPSDPHPRTPRFPAPLHLHTGLPGQYIGIITWRFPCARSRPRSVSAQGVTTPRRNARGHGTARRVWGSSWTLEAWRKVEESTVDLHVHYTTPFLSNPKPLGQRQKTITRTRWLQLDLSLEDNVAWNELLRESVFPDGKKMQKRNPLATQIWKLYNETKTQLPNQTRMENLTWRMMAMNLMRRELEQTRYVLFTQAHRIMGQRKDGTTDKSFLCSDHRNERHQQPVAAVFD
jgi:hypothetical protein